MCQIFTAWEKPFSCQERLFFLCVGLKTVCQATIQVESFPVSLENPLVVAKGRAVLAGPPAMAR